MSYNIERFAAHGGGPAFWQGQVFWVKPTGSFNMEGMAQMEERMRELILSGKPNRWVRLEVYEDKDTFGPSAEAGPLIFEHLRFNLESGCEYMVLVGGNLLVHEFLIQACAKVGLKTECFEQVDEACQWIGEQGFSFD